MSLMPPSANVVDVGGLWRTIVGALVASTLLVISYSVAILAWIRANDAWAAQRRGPAIVWGFAGVLGGAVLVAGIVAGIVIIATGDR
jgi:uncharacterized iron-regulated membrane protein